MLKLDYQKQFQLHPLRECQGKDGKIQKVCSLYKIHSGDVAQCACSKLEIEYNLQLRATRVECTLDGECWLAFLANNCQ